MTFLLPFWLAIRRDLFFKPFFPSWLFKSTYLLYNCSPSSRAYNLTVIESVQRKEYSTQGIYEQIHPLNWFTFKKCSSKKGAVGYIVGRPVYHTAAAAAAAAGISAAASCYLMDR